MSASVFLVGMTLESWPSFASLYSARKYPVPPHPAEGIWVVDSQRSPVGGVCIYPAGPYALFEHAIIDATKPLRVRAAAFELGLEALKAYCAARSVVPVCTVSSLGMKRFMQRRGWRSRAAIPMYLWPIELERK